MGEVYKSFAQINLARGEDNGGAVAESAFNRELLFKAWHGLRQKKKKEEKLRLKWISCFLSDYYYPSLPLHLSVPLSSC